MSIKTKQYCDRCGEEFEFSLSKCAGFFTRGIRKVNHIGFHTMYYGNTDGYNYSDYRYDLCADCTENLFRFLRGDELAKKV